MNEAQHIIIDYVSWTGVRSERRIIPKRIHFSESKWHGAAQWLLDAWDVDKAVERSFAMKDIKSWRPAPAITSPGS